MADGIGGIGLIGDVLINMMGLKRAARQDQLAADLAQQATANQRTGTSRAIRDDVEVPEIDPSRPVRRGQYVDIIA